MRNVIRDYEISSDKNRLDIAAIHDFLSRSYWSPGIPRSTVERAIANSPPERIMEKHNPNVYA